MRHDPILLRVCSGFAVLGAIGLVIGNIAGSIVVPGHDWVSDTVSDLAAGRYEIIQDYALYSYAGGLIGLSIAAGHLHRGTLGWTFAPFLLAALALCVTVIGARNEYGDRDSDGVVIHIYIVYVMGGLFVALFGLAGRETWHCARSYAVMSLICCLIWVIGAPVFFMMSTAYDGAFERALGLVTVVWVCWSAVLLSAHARRQSA